MTLPNIIKYISNNIVLYDVIPFIPSNIGLSF